MTDEASSELIERLKLYIEADAEAQRQKMTRQWALPLPERIRKGLALQNLSILEQREQNLYVIRCPVNDSRFREGDILVLHRGKAYETPWVSCVLEGDDEEILYVTPTEGDVEKLLLNREGWIADQGMLDMSPFYLKAIDQAADSNNGRENVLPLLQNTCQSVLDFEYYEQAYADALNAGLNESQAEAAAMAIAADLFHMIQGPPGTGKTRVLAHLCSRLVKKGQRVLVTSLTHRAINNALNKLFEIDPALPMCKVGLKVRASNLLTDNYENFAESPLAQMDCGYVVGATPFATQTERLKGIEFDVVVFDEASQVTLPLAMMGMLAGSKYIFIGDERQLPPVNSRDAEELGRRSIFGYLSGRGNETMLEVTYRMNTELTTWPSENFYDSRLRPAESAACRRLKIRPLYSPWDFALHPDEPVVFLDTEMRNTTTHSRAEAGIVSDLIQVLLQGQLPPYEIGVVTPYRAQARLIRSLLRRAKLTKDALRELVVDTVERMQGQEREVILVSWATSNCAFASDLADFLYQPERLNVAITRPRTKLIMVGSSELLKVQPAEEEIAAWVDLLRDLINHCTVYSTPNGSPGF